jgi:Cft2 family RNA processing exonuclease
MTRIRLHRLGVRLDDDGIEPSCGVMDVMEGSIVKYRIVTDCGLHPVRDAQPGEPRWHAPDLSLFEDGKAIDAVRLTHVHADHAGYVPALLPYFHEKTQVVMSAPSKAMFWQVLADGFAPDPFGGPSAYTEEAAVQTYRRVRSLLAQGKYDLLPGIRDYAHPEGHIPGACSFTSRIGGANVHFSGDRCGHDQPGILGALPLPAAWRPQIIANSDCTYGADPDSDLRDYQEEMDRGIEAGAAALRRGHPAVYFSFGVSRGGAVAHALQRHGVTGLAPVYLDGSCRAFSEIHAMPGSRWSDRETNLDLTDIMFVGGNRHRENLVGHGPWATVTTPGMGGPGGVGTFWRRHVLPDPEAVIVFTGYLAPGTDGDRIIKAARRRKAGETVLIKFEVQQPDGSFETEAIPLRCRVEQIRIGAHDSRSKILAWFRALAPEVAVLTHGSRKALASVADGLAGDIPRLVRSDAEPVIELDV